MTLRLVLIVLMCKGHTLAAVPVQMKYRVRHSSPPFTGWAPFCPGALSGKENLVSSPLDQIPVPACLFHRLHTLTPLPWVQ